MPKSFCSFQTGLSRHVGIAVAVRSHPRAKADAGALASQARREPAHLLHKTLPENPGQVVDCPLKKNQRVLDFQVRRHGTLAGFFRQPQGLYPRVHGFFNRVLGRSIQGFKRAADAQHVVEDTAALGLGRVRGQNRLNPHGAQQARKICHGNVLFCHPAEGAAQRHRRAHVSGIIVPKPADTLALLAKVHQVEEQAEGMRNVCGALQRKSADLAVAGEHKGAPLCVGLDPDPALQARLMRIVPRPLRAAVYERPAAASLQWEVHSCTRCDENASAMAGGKLLVSADMVRHLRLSDDELAYLIAHEMGHVLAQHTREFATIARYFVDNGLHRDYSDIRNELSESFPVMIRMHPVYVQQELEADYIGFEIPDCFVVGYGLDFAERYRNLQGVGVLTLKSTDKAQKSSD